MEQYWSSSSNSGVTYTGIMGFGDTNTPNAAGLSSLVTMMQPQPLHPLLMQNHSSSSAADEEAETRFNMKAKIMAHPLFPRLLSAYANCQKVGAPPEVVARLEQATAYHINVAAMSTTTNTSTKRRVREGDEDPELEQFMEAYCEMLIKYEEEITKPFKEAMIFLSKIDSQLKALTLHSSSQSASSSGEKCVARSASSEEEDDVMNSESYIDPQAGDRELKVQLMRKYSGYLGSLKQEFSKKKKIEKLPKEARNQLLDWWSRHYKWPYPTETEKLALAELTGLDMKQINNWFINQRKRHWKPSEDMQFVPLDPDHHLPRYYMDHNNVFFPTDCASTRSLE